jgi:hypothetical protein
MRGLQVSVELCYVTTLQRLPSTMVVQILRKDEVLGSSPRVGSNARVVQRLERQCYILSVGGSSPPGSTIRVWRRGCARGLGP